MSRSIATTPGSKIEFMRSNPLVCVEIEHFIEWHRWRCLVIEGRYREFHEHAAKKHAWGILIAVYLFDPR